MALLSRGSGLLICLLMAAPALGADKNKMTWRTFFEVLQRVETGGEKNPAEAIGDGGRSIGPYQISKAYWKDSGIPGSWSDCKKKPYAQRVIRAYMKRYVPGAVKKRKWETMARVHNGGPRGHKKRATLKYLTRFEQACKIGRRRTATMNDGAGRPNKKAGIKN